GATAANDVQVRVGPPVGPYTLSGKLRLPVASTLDCDLPTSSSDHLSNDDFNHAQTIPSPIRLGGYVAEPNIGPQLMWAGGDPADVYWTHLIANQTVRLAIGATPMDPTTAPTVSLQLYDADRNLIDASIVQSDSPSTTLSTPATGDYFIE